ncbi:MAG TPA: tRNA pseudouridine(13) synthase TruD [Thermoplasmata archaeon]|nr:tRNA pseudouridine(13) synthase TruD [Thermoplasmata archaeon]
MERDLGIQGYLTSTPGVGGILKAAAEDFVVEEVSSDLPRTPGGRYTIARVRVREWETNRLVRQLARSLHISRRRIGFAGTKDKRALTTQLVSFEGVPPESLRALRIKDVEILDAFPSSRGLEIGDLVGNAFRVVVRNLRLPPAEAAKAAAETTRQLGAFRGFPNFFGVQRFGSVRPVTHEVGRHLVHGGFREAVETYAANPIAGEDPESYEVREAFAESGDVKEALRTYPKAYTFEKAILSHLAVHPDDYVGALRVLPPNLLIMFVHAYQSFLYNRILSERMRRGLPIHEPIVGDLVLPADRRGLPDRDRAIEVTPDNVARATERCHESKGWVSAILYGSETRFADGEMGAIERSIVGSEGLRPEDFIIPEIPRISSRGTRREILAPFRSLATRVEDGTLQVEVELTRGAYATCLLREYMKGE